MTASSARPSSASERPLQLARGEIGIWLRASDVSDSESFARDLLSRLSGLVPAQLEIERSEQGKPFLINAPQPLQFSLSHSGRWMACAVALESPLGVDLEVHNPQRDVMPLVRRFFREAEYRELAVLEPRARLQRFYDLWTLKEARVKALGSSLGRELETTGFRIDEGAGGVQVISSQCGSGDAFYCLLSVLPEYSLGLCCLPAGDCPPRVRVARLLETGKEQAMPARLLAASTC